MGLVRGEPQKPVGQEEAALCWSLRAGSVRAPGLPHRPPKKGAPSCAKFPGGWKLRLHKRGNTEGAVDEKDPTRNGYGEAAAAAPGPY